MSQLLSERIVLSRLWPFLVLFYRLPFSNWLGSVHSYSEFNGKLSVIRVPMTPGQLSAFIKLLLLFLLQFEVNSITQEDVRFATMRCQAVSTSDPDLRLQWSAHTFPDNSETHCYVKCLLSKLGLIDLKHMGLDEHKFTQPLESQNIEISKDCYDQLEEKLPGTCKGYYDKWILLKNNCKDLFIGLLLDKQHSSSEILVDRNSKSLGESASEFCSRQESIDVSDLEVSSGQLVGNGVFTQFKCELGCLFRHIHYFDAYGRLDALEIWQSFEEANSALPDYAGIVQNCVHRANALFSIGTCEMALEFFRCLLHKIPTFNQIYKQRDLLSRGY